MAIIGVKKILSKLRYIYFTEQNNIDWCLNKQFINTSKCPDDVNFKALFTEWLDTVYFPTNLSRLSAAYNYTRKRLIAMGIKVHHAKAGFFIWADFSHVSYI